MVLHTCRTLLVACLCRIWVILRGGLGPNYVGLIVPSPYNLEKIKG